MTEENTFVVVPSETVKMLTLNIDCLPFPLTKGAKERAEEMCKQIISEGVDIVCFQECFDKEAQNVISQEFMKTHPYQILHQRYHAFGMFDWINWLEESGLVVVSRYEITGQQFVPFINIEGVDSLCWKGTLGFSVKISDDKSLTCFTTHLNSDSQWNGSKDESETRRLELLEIEDFMSKATLNDDERDFANLWDKHRVQPLPNVILCGDLNFSEETEQYEWLFEDTPLTDVWRKCYPDKEKHPGYTWDGVRNQNMVHGKSRHRIDYFIDKHNNIEFKKDGCQLFIPGEEPYRCLSDHFGVICEIVISSLNSNKPIQKYNNYSPCFLSRVCLQHHPFI